MKIALCLHGLFDSRSDSTSLGIDGYNHIYNHILKNNNVDVFIHSWDVNKKDEINDLYNPKKSMYDHQIQFDDIIYARHLNTLQNCPRDPKSILSHFYSIQQSFKLCYSSSDFYDVVIKSRFDLGRINRNTSFINPVQCIKFDPKLNMNFLYMADWPLLNQGPPDMWFYSNYNNMRKFTCIYDDLLNSFYLNSEFHSYAYSVEQNTGDLSNSIIFLKYWFEKQLLWDSKFPLKTIYE